MAHIWAAERQNQQNDLCTQRRLRSACTSFLSTAPWGRDSDQSSLFAQRVAKDPSFLHADIEDSDQTGRMPRLILVFAGRTSFVLSCTGGYPVLSHYQCQQTRSVHNEYSWYLSRQTSIPVHPAFWRNKSIAYLENKYWTDRCHSACKRELLFCRKLRLQWLCIFKRDTVHLQR